MTALAFRPESAAFPRWMGPFSPARGSYSGFRVRDGRLGTWVADDDERAFWPVVVGPGARMLVQLVWEQWGGGRVLLLPNGFVVKPLQRDDHVGKRVLIGRVSGPIVLVRPDGR